MPVQGNAYIAGAVEVCLPLIGDDHFRTKSPGSCRKMKKKGGIFRGDSICLETAGHNFPQRLRCDLPGTLAGHCVQFFFYLKFDDGKGIVRNPDPVFAPSAAAVPDSQQAGIRRIVEIQAAHQIPFVVMFIVVRPQYPVQPPLQTVHFPGGAAEFFFHTVHSASAPSFFSHSFQRPPAA